MIVAGEVMARIARRRIEASGPLETPCRLWMGSRNADGYGTVKVDGRVLLVHRAVYAISEGIDLPRSVLVRHRCDTPPCSAEDHLIGGSHLDNLNDRRAAGRWRVDGAWYARRKAREGRARARAFMALVAQAWEVIYHEEVVP